MKDLNLPQGHYVIVGAGSLAAYDLRETSDIDLVVTEDLFRLLAEQGWEIQNRTDGKTALKHGHAEAFLDVNAEGFRPTTEELLERAVIIDGVPFASLEDVRAFKIAYGREKDRRDVKLIDGFLEANT